MYRYFFGLAQWMVKYASPFMLQLCDVLKVLLSEKIESCGKCIEDCIGAYRKSLSLWVYSSLKSALLSAVSQSSSFLYILTRQFPLPSPLRWLWFLMHLQQNSSPAPGPDPKPTMIDEWAVSVKPNTDPTIIKKHIEKMVEVSVFTPTHAPFPGSCWLYASVPGRRGGSKWGALGKSSVLILSTTVLTL